MIRVGLVGPPEREELQRLAIRLEERSAEGVSLDPRGDPAIRLGPEVEEACGVDLRGLAGLYVVDLGLPPAAAAAADGTIDPEESALRAARSRRSLAAWNALLERLAARVPVVNPPRSHDLHTLKPWELDTYAAAGLPAPATVATSDPRALRLLPDGRRWVRKGMVGGYGYTTAFEPPADRAAAEEALAAGTIMVQERVEGDNVRAFVLDGALIGAAAVFPTDGAEVDSRRDTQRLERLELPAEARRTAEAAARCWGMPFCAVDLMRDERDGRYVLLECNSAPFFVEFERRTGLDLSGRLADHLLGRRFGGY